LKAIAKPFFKKYDTDASGTLSQTEFIFLLQDLGEITTEHQGLAAKKFQQFDVSEPKGSIDFNEFLKCLESYMRPGPERDELDKKVADDRRLGKMKTMPSYGIKNDDDEDEEEEMPEDIAALDPAVQQRRIIMRSMWMMLLGTFIVLFVSDPFVDVLNVWGQRLDVPGFYVSFVVAPFASNASELLSAYQYARKKTKKDMTTALSTLVGAACMNNTFVLAVFFALLYFKGLAWEFTAETIAIMAVQWLIGIVALMKDTQTVFMGCVIFSCYPLCLGIVAGLESIGFD